MQHNLAVIIPIYKQYEELAFSERLSLHRTFKVLGGYDIVFVTHKGIDATAYCPDEKSIYNFKVHEFSADYFTGLAGYNKLLLGLEFYQSVAEYEYLLICQLDVYVFENNVDYFVNKGYDYIGAPWFEGFDKATSDSPIIGVGNGGFSLRNVKSFLTVLYALEALRSMPSFNILKAVASHPLDVLRVAKHEYHRRTRRYEVAVPWETPLYEDHYWGTVVNKYFPWFKVASVEDAAAFAFEVNPTVLYERNHNRLPMGTHAWEKYDPEFWQPFIPKPSNKE